MGKLCHELGAPQPRLALLQALAGDLELGLRLTTLAQHLRLGESALHCSRQAYQIRLDDIIGRPVLQRADRVFLAERSRHENKRGAGCQLPGAPERVHAVELRHREIRKDHVGSELAQRSDELFLAIDNAMADAQARTLDLSDLELG